MRRVPRWGGAGRRWDAPCGARVLIRTIHVQWWRTPRLLATCMHVPTQTVAVVCVVISVSRRRLCEYIWCVDRATLVAGLGSTNKKRNGTGKMLSFFSRRKRHKPRRRCWPRDDHPPHPERGARSMRFRYKGVSISVDKQKSRRLP